LAVPLHQNCIACPSIVSLLIECSTDRRDGGGLERLAQIDPSDFSPERRSERRD